MFTRYQVARVRFMPLAITRALELSRHLEVDQAFHGPAPPGFLWSESDRHVEDEDKTNHSGIRDVSRRHTPLPWR